jgi:hypothetical protein
MKNFVFKVNIVWLPSTPDLEFNGTMTAENETQAREQIIEQYMFELGLTDENDVTIVELEEA